MVPAAGRAVAVSDEDRAGRQATARDGTASIRVHAATARSCCSPVAARGSLAAEVAAGRRQPTRGGRNAGRCSSCGCLVGDRSGGLTFLHGQPAGGGRLYAAVCRDVLLHAAGC